MDKYQNLAFYNGTKYCVGTKGLNRTYAADIENDNDALILNQNENVNLVDYCFIICCEDKKSPIKNVCYFLNDKWCKVSPVKSDALLSWDERITDMADGYSFYCVDLCFDNRVTSIRFEYKNNIVEPYELKINYIEASKEAYYKKVTAQHRQELLQAMSLQCKTGDALVNFFWQIARADVKKVRIELFLDNKQLIMKTDMNTDMLFKSIQGLAYGTYYYKVSQLNEKDEIVVESDLLSFNLSAPNYSGEHTVVI